MVKSLINILTIIPFLQPGFFRVWNYMSERDLMVGVKDLDLVYFDATDLSEETENAYIQRVCEQVGGLSIHIDVKNEARVHLWY
jgi:hypothetical protein